MRFATYVLVLACLPALQGRAAAAANTPLYRSYNGGGIDHLYSTIPNEGAPGWAPEGTLGLCEPFPTVSGNVATMQLHRLWNPTFIDHFYTIDAAEAQRAVTLYGYVEETATKMPNCWVWPTQVPGTCAVYRMYRTSQTGGGTVAPDHFYTTDGVEVANALKQVPRLYQLESSHAWYMVPRDYFCR